VTNEKDDRSEEAGFGSISRGEIKTAIHWSRKPGTNGKTQNKKR